MEKEKKRERGREKEEMAGDESCRLYENQAYLQNDWLLVRLLWFERGFSFCTLIITKNLIQRFLAETAASNAKSSVNTWHVKPSLTHQRCTNKVLRYSGTAIRLVPLEITRLWSQACLWFLGWPSRASNLTATRSKCCNSRRIIPLEPDTLIENDKHSTINLLFFQRVVCIRWFGYVHII